MTRVLVLANEHVNRRMAGPAIRCFELAGQLAGAGLAVTLGSPFPSDLPSSNFPLVVYDAGNIGELARAHDIVVLQGWVLERFPVLRDCGARLVVDLYDPFPLEELILAERQPLDMQLELQANTVRAVSNQIRDGDFFLCASEKQRDYWLGWLTALNRVNPHVYHDDPTLRQLIDVVPFGIPRAAPVRKGPAYRDAHPGIGSGDLVLIWGGGIYNWFDPMTLIRGVALASATRDDLRLVFMSTGHPNPGTQEMWTLVEARRLSEELGLSGRHVFFNEGWIEYDRRADWLLEADIGVSTHFDHVETRFSFRTRILDYLWCGLPVITTAGDAMADAVERNELGRVIPPENADAAAAAILSLADDGAARTACSERIRSFAQNLTWDVAARPLIAYCRLGRQAADLAAIAPRRRMPVPLDEAPGDGDPSPLRKLLGHRRRQERC